MLDSLVYTSTPILSIGGDKKSGNNAINMLLNDLFDQAFVKPSAGDTTTPWIPNRAMSFSTIDVTLDKYWGDIIELVSQLGLPVTMDKLSLSTSLMVLISELWNAKVQQSVVLTPAVEVTPLLALSKWVKTIDSEPQHLLFVIALVDAIISFIQRQNVEELSNMTPAGRTGYIHAVEDVVSGIVSGELFQSLRAVDTLLSILPVGQEYLTLLSDTIDVIASQYGAIRISS